MELKTYFAQDAQGNVIPNPAVHVYFVGTTTYATGLKNATGGALANPFTGSDKGQIQFAAPNGDYDMRVVSGVRDYSIRVRFVDIDDQRLLAEAAANRSAQSAGQSEASATKSEASAAAAALIAYGNLIMHPKKITESINIPDGFNAFLVDPVEIGPNVTVTGLGNSTLRGI